MRRAGRAAAFRGGPSPARARGVQGVMSDARKQSLYFPEEMLRQMQEEAIRQDRSLSWVVQRAWRLAHERIAKLPDSGVAQPPGAPVAHVR